MEQPLAVPAELDGRIHHEDYRDPFWREHVSPRHVHRYVELYLSLRGRAVTLIGDRRVDIPAGSLWWVSPGVEHELLEVSSSHRRFNLALRTRAVRRVLTRREAQLLLAGSADAPCCVQLGRPELDRLASIWHEVATLHDRGPTAFNAGLAYALARAVLAHREAAPSGEPTALHPAVARALGLMRGDGLALGRDELAARCGLSVTHLSRLFTRELGQPLREVRNRRRVARVLELMKAGDYSLTEAALDAGFGSYSQFHRVYSALTGAPPSRALRRRA